MDKVIGIGEYAISDNTEDVLKTFALSSCVALTAYYPRNKVMGMVHIALPFSQEKQIHNPFYYAETAIPALIEKMCIQYGCNKPGLEIKLYGGAESTRKGDVFNIGKRNMEMIVSILNRMNLPVRFCDTGGHLSRNISADVATGAVKVNSQPICF